MNEMQTPHLAVFKKYRDEGIGETAAALLCVADSIRGLLEDSRLKGEITLGLRDAMFGARAPDNASIFDGSKG